MLSHFDFTPLLFIDLKLFSRHFLYSVMLSLLSLKHDDINLFPSPNPTPFRRAGLVYLLWASNMIGVACARSLHFQFLIWYFHSLPFLLMASGVPLPVRLAFILVLELAWNAHPPGETSSMIVTGCHAVLLLLLTYADNAFLADFFDGLRWKGSRAGKGEEMETLGGIPTSAGSDSKRHR